MTLRSRIALLISPLAALALASCEGDSPTATRGNPPVIEDYRPADSVLTLDLGQSVLFSVDASDPDGDRLSHRFMLDGNVVATQPRWTSVIEDTGAAVVSCVVSDGENETRVDWTVIRRHVNRPPMIRSFLPATSVIELDVGEELAFAIDAVDPDGDVLEHYFRIDGALASTTDDVVFMAVKPGRIAVEAFVWDGELVVSHRWMVTINGPEINRPPVIYLREPVDDAPVILLGEVVQFRIRASDPDGDAMSYVFELDGEEVSSMDRFTFQPDEAGEYHVTATASDGENAVATAWTLTVDMNDPPVIVNHSPTSPTIEVTQGTQVIFSVGAVDPDGDPLDYLYRLDGVGVGTQPSWVFTPPAPGTRAVRVEVSDGQLTAVYDWQVVVVAQTVNHPPTIESYTPAGFDLTAYAGDVVEFSVTAADADGDVLVVSYRVNGAHQSDGAVFPFSSAGAGFYDIEAVVSDGTLSTSHLWQLTLLDPSESLHGRLRNAVTGEALSGLSLEIGAASVTSDGLGRFSFPGLPPYGGTLTVRDEVDPDQFGDYFDYIAPYGMDDGNFLDLFLLPNIAVASPYYSDFHLFYRAMTDVHGIPPSTASRRWALPVDIYVPAFTAGGLDYRQTIIDVFAEFDAILGRQAFRIVDAIPETGVDVSYSGTIYADNYRVLDWSDDYYPVRGHIQFRTRYTPSTVNPFRVTIRHELGHALGLNHSVDPHHLMVGGQTPGTSTFTEEERGVLKARYHIPRGQELLYYVRD